MQKRKKTELELNIRAQKVKQFQNGLKLFWNSNSFFLNDLVYKGGQQPNFKLSLFNWTIFINNISFATSKILKLLRLVRPIYQSTSLNTANLSYLHNGFKNVQKVAKKSISINFKGWMVYTLTFTISQFFDLKTRAGVPARVFKSKNFLQFNFETLNNTKLTDSKLDYYDWTDQMLIRFLPAISTKKFSKKRKGFKIFHYFIFLLLKIGLKNGQY